MSNLEIIHRPKGNPEAFHDGYRRHKQNNENIIYWACIKEHSLKCKGRMISKDDAIVKVSPHTCIPEEAGNEVLKQIFVARKRAREEEDLQIDFLFEYSQNIRGGNGENYINVVMN